MGNNRQQLKEKIASNLRNKIEGTKKILSGLEIALVDIQRNSTKAQEDVQTSFDDLYQVLLSRKLKLMMQIEELSLVQRASVQESIQQAYQELGSLQSTLFHIDSFDMGQLANVRIDSEWMNFNGVPPPVKTTLDSKALKNEISKWGSTFVDLQPVEPQSSTSDASKTPQASTSPKKLNVLDFDVDLWLRQIKSQTSCENDDFEMVFAEPESSEKIQETEVLSKSSDCKDSVSAVGETTVSITDDDSCMDSSDEPIVEDLSKWLKPKKTNDRCTKADLSKWLKPRNTNNLSSISPNSALVPPEVIQQKFNSGSTIASKSKFLDYPCLRLESSCWLHKKVPKENVNYNLRTDFSLTLSEKQIIPPTYALPYPFWLKKC